MSTLLAIVFLAGIFHLFIQFARQESVEDEYEDAIIDVEGRLEWGSTRRHFPFGMKAQLEVSRELLDNAKALWGRNQWRRAYLVALESQEAMNRAQNIYSSARATSYRRDCVKGARSHC